MRPVSASVKVSIPNGHTVINGIPLASTSVILANAAEAIKEGGSFFYCFFFFFFFNCSLDFRLSLFSLIIIPSVVELVVYVEGICGQSNADLQAVPASLSPHPWPHLSCGSSLLFFTVCLRSLITKLMCNDTHFLQHTVTVGVSSRRKPYSIWHFFPLPACSHSDSLRKPSICYRL